MVLVVCALLARGVPGTGVVSIGLADLITLATHRHHNGGGVCPAPRDFVSAGASARIQEASARRVSLFRRPAGRHMRFRGGMRTLGSVPHVNPTEFEFDNPGGGQPNRAHLREKNWAEAQVLRDGTVRWPRLSI